MAAGRNLRVLNRDQVSECAPSMVRILEITRAVYGMDAADETQVPTKIAVHPPHPGSFLHAMPARLDAIDKQGLKWVAYYPDSGGAPDSHAVILLSDSKTGESVALLEGMWITYARTAACVAVLAEKLALPANFTLGLVGAGALARSSLSAIAAAMPDLEQVLVASRTRNSAEQLVDEITASGCWRAEVMDSPAEVLAAAHLVVSSTTGHGDQVIDVPKASEARVIVPLEGPNVCTHGTLRWPDRVVSDDFGQVSPQLPDELLEGVRQRHVYAGELFVDSAQGVIARPTRNLVFVTGKASFDVAIAEEVLAAATDRGIGTDICLT